MYRDELAALRSRYHLARQRLDDARADLREQLALVDTLREQLKGRDMRAPEAPEMDEGPELGEAPDDAKAIQLAELAGHAERETERVVAARHIVARLAVLLTRRLMGEDVVMPLGSPPRRLPWTYLLAEAARWWAVMVAFVAAAGARALAATSPRDALLCVMGAGALLAVPCVRALLRGRFLARCQQAVATTVVSSDSGSTEMSNWPLARSKGWDVTVEIYSGNGRHDVVEFLTEDGQRGRLTLAGTGYDGGVVLYAPDSMKAFDVKQLGCRPRPGADGGWSGALAFGVWVRTLLFAAGLACLGAAAALAHDRYRATPSHPQRSGAVAKFTPNRSHQMVTARCRCRSNPAGSG